MIALRASNLSKTYPVDRTPWSRFRHALHPQSHRDNAAGIHALRDVTFSVNQGEAFGIIGSNGSGKSTFLQIAAGILRPTSGEIEVNGRLSALLELGSGFSPEFTGRQNVFLNASILGLSQEQIAAKFETIESFASIGDFIDQPIRTYSSGMVLRLAFAVVAHVDPEVLIVDEALAVGDIAFRQRCMRRIHDLRAQGVTILFVSHDTGDIKALCQRCVWLERGEVKRLGETDDVVGEYLSAALQRDTERTRTDRGTHSVASAVSLIDNFSGRHRFGNQRALITGIQVTTPDWEPLKSWVAGASAVIHVQWRANTDLEEPIVGYLVRNDKGETLFGTNTSRENHPLPAVPAGPGDAVEFHITLPELTAGTYFVSAAVSEGAWDKFDVCDYIEDAICLEAPENADPVNGYLKLRCRRVSLY